MEKANREEAIENFKVLDDISHVLTVPARYIGTINEVEQDMYLYRDDKFTFQTIKFIPGLLKIIEEILDNSVDAYLNDKNRKPIRIDVSITKNSVTVKDTGSGIPVVAYKDSSNSVKGINGKYLPELAWGRLKAGGSFKKERSGAGTHGEGSSLTNIFSKVFIGKTCDGSNVCTVSCSNNMRKINTTVEPLKGKKYTGTEVYFEPELERFGLTEITEIHSDLIYQRLLNLSVSFPDLKFFFNGKQVKIVPSNFIKLFSESGMSVNSDNIMIGVFPSSTDEFQQYSFVNGLRTSKGGAHIDYVVNQIVNPIKDKLTKKFKTLKFADIKNRLGVVVFLKNFKNPQFNSQTKETLANVPSDISGHINGKIDFEAFVKLILKNDAIIDPIVETFKIKEELKARQEIKKTKKLKISADKYMPPIGAQKYLILAEGQSALAGISQCLGRNGIGYYALRGLPLNCYDSSIQKIAANQEVKDILSILGLDITKPDETDHEINFEKVLIGVDADSDGVHLASMLVGWFKRFSQSLYDKGKICRLNTPVAIIKNNKDKILNWFFNINDFKEWESKNDVSKFKVVYLKGLGSLEKEDLQYIIDHGGGYESLIETYVLDEGSNQIIEDWLGSNSEPRKQYLREYTFDINSI